VFNLKFQTVGYFRHIVCVFPTTTIYNYLVSYLSLSILTFSESLFRSSVVQTWISQSRWRFLGTFWYFRKLSITSWSLLILLLHQHCFLHRKRMARRRCQSQNKAGKLIHWAKTFYRKNRYRAQNLTQMLGCLGPAIGFTPSSFRKTRPIGARSSLEETRFVEFLKLCHHLSPLCRLAKIISLFSSNVNHYVC